jgi:RHS repeat-associated protein
VNPATATISINDIPSGAIYGSNFTVTYSYSGNGSPTESVSSSTTGVCTVSGNTVYYVGAGTCTLTASASATTNYTAATGVTQSFTVSQATPTIFINNLPSWAVYAGNFTATYSYTGNGSPSVSSSTTGVCTVSGNTVNYVGTGTCTLTASATATTNYTAVTGGTQSFTVSQATPTISISDIPSGAVYAGNFTVTYSYSGNGSPSESVSSSTTGVCTVSGNTVNYVSVGTCTLTASASATTNYTAATGVTQSFTVSQATPTIFINNLPSWAVYAGNFTATYSYTGNGSPSVSSSTTGVCTVSGNTVNYVGTGTCTLTASATATTNYTAVTGGTQSFTVSQATPTISISDIPSGAVYAGNFTVTYSYSGNGSPSESVSSSTTGVCTVSGNTVNYVSVGTCTLTASATATTNYTAVTGGAQSFTVSQATPTISISDIPSGAVYGGNFTVTYSYSGNGSPSESVSSSTTGVCTVSGNTVNYVSVGTCTLTASATATTNYTAVTGNAQSFTIGLLAPTISVASSGSPSTYGNAVTFTATVTNGDTNTVTFSDGSTSIGTATPSNGTATLTTNSLPAGSNSIMATIAGAGNYASAYSSTITQTVNKASVTVSAWPTATSLTYGQTLSSSTLNGGTVSVGGMFAWTTPGTIPPAGMPLEGVTFTPSASTNYNAVTGSVSVSVSPATPTISISNIPTNALYSGSFHAAYSYSGSGSPVESVSSSTTGVCTVSGSIVSFILEGTCTLTASAAATANYTAATGSPQSFTVSTLYDSGTVTLAIGGSTVAQANYGPGSTFESVAAALVNSNNNQAVTITEDSGTLYIVSKATGSSSTNLAYTLTSTSNYPSVFTSPSFQATPGSGSLEGGANQNASIGTIYSYALTYDSMGNVISATEPGMAIPLMGSWSYTYDSLNRLATANSNQPGNPYPYYCWSYDSFGNRLQQISASSAFQSSQGGPNACPAGPGQNLWAQYNGTTNGTSNNQMSATSQNQSQGQAGGYDQAGNMLNDGGHQYLYDGEGRICATMLSYNGIHVMTGYVYDAEGRRVAKGSITAFSCNLATNGFQTTTDYIMGQGGETMTEMGVNASGALTPQHNYAYANGALLATYDLGNVTISGSTYNGQVLFRFTDWLGTLRVTTDYGGESVGTCTGLAFGDGVSCQGEPADSHHFTGKERDTESGNDYFGARYYASSMGRWMSPDWSAIQDPIPYADIDNPQTLNLYAYVQNNPLTLHDATGHYHCDPDYSTTNGNGDMVVHAGACHMDWSDFQLMGAALGHHFIPKQVWADISKASDAWKFLNKVTTRALKNPRLSNSFDHLHRGLNKQTEELVSDLEKQLGKSVEDFNKGDLQELASRLERAGGDFEKFNARMEALEPEARTFGEAVGQALEEVFPAAAEAATEAAPLAGDAAEGAAAVE